MNFTKDELHIIRTLVSDRYFYWKGQDEDNPVPREWRPNNVAAHLHRAYKKLYEKLMDDK